MIAETVWRAFVREALVDGVVVHRMNVADVWVALGCRKSGCNIGERDSQARHQPLSSRRGSYSPPEDSAASNFGQGVGRNEYPQRLDRGLPPRLRNLGAYLCTERLRIWDDEVSFTRKSSSRELSVT